MELTSGFTSCLQKYLDFEINKNTQEFTIVEGNDRILPDEESGEKNPILLVLDSSFNPPHWGHYTLIKKSYEYYSQSYPNKKIHVLLLLSVQNADKEAKPASFDKRMDMMCIMSRLLNKNFESLSTYVGLTIFGKFVDKDSIIRKKFFNQGVIVYLVGFDTIIRIFDPKYYIPQALAVVLQHFMKNVEFCCLTRSNVNDNESEDFTNQSTYSQDILQGKYEPLIPKEWGHKINILSNNPKYINVSSSKIRKLMVPLHGTKSLNEEILNDLKKQLPNQIIEYIIQSSESKSIFSA
ncbi:nicotinamide-nucleotide adenylyltransferase PWA37_002821 [Arxiozyma heterogenica]|uniref:nicotinamide-nucleotide adenylyltransferase n=1 Tax=Arxiozyma heterogenica TaxID=278026 RepID=UPI002EF6A86F